LHALGFNQRQLAAYWRSFFRLALADPAVRVFALEDESGDVMAAVAVAYQGFPSPANGLRFLARLLCEIGPAGWLRYLRFAQAYGRVMRRPAHERRREACGLWLFVRSEARGLWLGSTVVREAIDALSREGKSLITGFVDAGDRQVVAFYRRLGFVVSHPFPFRGLTAATIEFRVPDGTSPSC